MTLLTRHPEGSVRELWTISLPLMISTFASLLMIFTDRIFLARYSVAALNACVTSGSLAWAVTVAIGMITAMSEIFVAQYNGAKRYDKLGVPVWQMLWFALFSYVLFIPLGLWAGPYLCQGSLYADLEITYFRWLMFFGPSYALMTAFAGFFIGRGKTAMMIWLAVIANLLNIVLDWILIFGVPGIIPELGIQGAAIATCTGYLFEAVMLAAIFLKKSNREQFGTGNWKIDFAEMGKCIKIGFPQGIFCGFEVFGWTIFYWMMTSLGETHITVSSICQSFTILLSFFYDGLCRGAAAVAGNLIGAQKHHLIPRVIRSGAILLLLFTSFSALLLVADPQDTVRLLFFEDFEGLGAKSLDPAMISALKTCMYFSFIYMFFEGFRWLLSGILVAAGDTFFLLLAGALSVWVFLLIPIYFIVVKQMLSVEYAWGLATVYAGLLMASYWIRFTQGAWKTKQLIDSQEETAS